MKNALSSLQEAILWIPGRTVSKWECGRGLLELARLLGVGAEELLQGDLRENPSQGGNMKNLKCYFCPHCGALGFSVPEMKHSCCGRILEPLAPQTPDAAHAFHVEVQDDARQVTLDHPMDKAHHLLMLAFVSGEKCLLFRQYPEWEARAELPLRGHGRLLALCSRDGLFEMRLESRLRISHNFPCTSFEKNRSGAYPGRFFMLFWKR